ncbi:MAG: hypothetical protein K8F25_05320 [Fimbriimonadaceae bacterium]|nr:hypothetical protein [Alphaproteobacteria bacterium]
MKLFATRVWGFDPTAWPVVTFGLDGNRDNLLKKSSVGDAVVFVGTQGEPTQENERGRLLGIAQFGRVPVDTLDVLEEADINPNNYDKHGQFKWPKALLMTQAWRFTDDPLPRLVDVLEAQLPYNATAQAVELNEVDTAAVKVLIAEYVPLPNTAALITLRRLDTALSQSRPTTGIIPSAWQSTIERKLGNPSVTYALRFGKFDCWKVGHTTDVQRRLNEVNKHIPVEVLNSQWVLAMQQKWPDENLAYDMEQRVFTALNQHRTSGERIQCSQTVLQSAWIDSIAGIKK